METHHRLHLDRIDRLMRIVQSDDPYKSVWGLTFFDLIIFTCQCMWHMKDWIINDPAFEASNLDDVLRDIYAERSLMICADIANGSKHLALRNPKTDSTLSEQMGVDLNPSKGIHREYYFIISSNANDPFHGMEIRDFLSEARQAWERIINKHYLTKFTF